MARKWVIPRQALYLSSQPLDTWHIPRICFYNLYSPTALSFTLHSGQTLAKQTNQPLECAVCRCDDESLGRRGSKMITRPFLELPNTLTIQPPPSTTPGVN